MPSKAGQHQKFKHQRSHSESSDKHEQEQTTEKSLRKPSALVPSEEERDSMRTSHSLRADEREAQADTRSLRLIVAGLFLLTVLLAFYTVYVHQSCVSPLQSEVVELRKKISEVYMYKLSRSECGEFTMSNLKIPNFLGENYIVHVPENTRVHKNPYTCNKH